jgi:hypothetical protein
MGFLMLSFTPQETGDTREPLREGKNIDEALGFNIFAYPYFCLHLIALR